jgi:hypothetical protein
MDLGQKTSVVKTVADQSAAISPNIAGLPIVLGIAAAHCSIDRITISTSAVVSSRTG